MDLKASSCKVYIEYQTRLDVGSRMLFFNKDNGILWNSGEDLLWRKVILLVTDFK